MNLLSFLIWELTFYLEARIGMNMNLLNPDYIIEFVMSVAIAKKSGCLEILA